MRRLLFVFSLLMASGCGSESPPNLVIVSVDTLRRDVLGPYGWPLPTSPHLDALASRSVVLDSCYVSCPRTTQSFATLMTGLNATHHGAFGLFHELAGDVTTLAERLSAEGYSTAAVVTNRFLQRGRGFEQGFQAYDDSLIRAGTEGAADVFERAQAALPEVEGGPFFLWIHFLDPHWPYSPPDPLIRRLDPGYDRAFTLYEDITSGKITNGRLIFENPLDDADRRHVRRRYVAEAAFADSQIGRLLDLLQRRGLMDNTILLFYSDHGESLGEHDYFYAHGEKLFQPTVHVPAFIYAEPLPAGRYSGLVSNEDLMPTLLALMGLDPPGDLDGMNLAESIRNGSPSSRETVYFESDYQFIHAENPDFHIPGPEGKWRAVLHDGYKLIKIPDPAGDRYELYGLEDDPEEKRNVLESRPREAQRLRSLLVGWENLLSQQRSRASGMDEATRERLRSLGYVN